LSADQTSITGVNQVFSPLLSFAEQFFMEFDFSFAIKDSPIVLKWFFVVRVPRVTIYREIAEHIPLTAFRWRCDEVE